METKRILTEYVEKEIMRRQGGVVSEEMDLLSNGILNSLSLLQLISFVERTFDRQIPVEEIVYENFHSVSAMANYLAGNGSTS
ncbi:MAG: acyl carrier protein [Anaerolineae bacterium]|nr:acyl carrier protein [Anaerolineae bacterium]